MRIKNGHVQNVERSRHWEEIGQDLSFGLRQLFRRPALPLIIILLLVLGIGINTAIFSVVKKVLLEPLPFEKSENVMALWQTDKRASYVPISGPNFLDWREQSQSFETLVAYEPRAMNLTSGGDPERLQGTVTTAGLFELLRVQPAMGRTFVPEEEQPGKGNVVILSDGLWRHRFGADPDLLGETITLDRKGYTVVGIMPPGFQHPCPWSIGDTIDVWVPFPRNELEGSDRGQHSFLALGRLAAGVTQEAAQGEMDVIAQQLAEAYPDDNEDEGINVVPAHGGLVRRIEGQLVLLLGAAGFVLLIVCGNVAGILLAKATTRQTEVAIRSSLGASRARVIRQLVTENIPLFLIGGCGGALLARWSIEGLRALFPADIPRIQETGIDLWVLAFTLGISLATGIIFGLIPALSVSKTDLVESLKQGRGAVHVGRSRMRNVLVVTQFALTLVLAHGAALMLASYRDLRNQDHGFRTEGVLTMRLDMKGPQYEETLQVRTFFDEAIERIEALPGIERAGAISRLPLEGGTNGTSFAEGQENEEGTLVEIKVTTPQYFEAMGIPFLAGRNLRDEDGHLQRPGVVVNESLARRFWPDEDPIGKRFRFSAPIWLNVVGVVGDTRQWGLERGPLAEAYFPYIQAPEVPPLVSFGQVKFLVVRTEGDPMGLVGAIRREILAVDPYQPISDIRTTDMLVDQSIARRKFNTILIGLFAAIGLILVAAGIYGVMAYFVSQRSHEIGVRIALGANRSSVLKMVLGQGLSLTALGVALGLIGVFAATKLIGSIVYGVSPTDPATLVGGLLFLVTVGTAGSLIPASRATRIDPVSALREE